MDEHDTMFDERENSIRRSREVGTPSLSALEDLGQAPAVGGVGHPYTPSFKATDAGNDDLEELRRDVARLEGKVDALLAALEVEDGE